jgi:adenosylcobinamide kinase/adenosylcobinamide-phosphate guanylyltransferase
MTLIVLIGGARSGKSDLAVTLAERQPAPVVYIATAQAKDADMALRIEEHRRRRPGSWATVEQPLALRESIQAAGREDFLVVDCLTLWTANALEALGAQATEAQALTTAAVAAERPGSAIVVTNEVGLGLVPANGLGRSYRDLLGRINAIWADAAAHVLLLVAGRILPLTRPESIEELLQ